MLRSLLLLALTLLSARSETFVPRGSAAEWKFSTAAAPENWKAGDFDDSAWTPGKAPLGFGDEGLTTEIKVPEQAAQRPLTVWFRHSFTVAETGDKPLVLKLRADDGAAIYLNGAEVARFNLAKNAGAETTAELALSDSEEGLLQRFSVQSAALRKGRNVLAVEVHQASRRSSDLWLDLSLETDTRQPEGSAKLTETARQSTMAYYRDHYVPAGMKIADGYVDGGRRMVLGKEGVVLSTREILVVDRSRDPSLRKHLEKAQSPELQKLPAADRARELARYVDRALSPSGDRAAALNAVEMFTIEHANRPVLFGEMEQACQAGVCRHRALLFKMLCDEAGLKTALVRGNYNRGLTRGGHAWNELILDDGSIVLVDVMNPSIDFAFLPESSAEAKYYLSVKNEPIYPRHRTESAPAPGK